MINLFEAKNSVFLYFSCNGVEVQITASILVFVNHYVEKGDGVFNRNIMDG